MLYISKFKNLHNNTPIQSQSMRRMNEEFERGERNPKKGGKCVWVLMVGEALPSLIAGFYY